MKQRWRNALRCLAIGSAAWATLVSAQRVHLSDVGIVRLGSHTGFTFFVQLDKAPPAGCAWALAYCSSGDPECKARMALVMAARAQGLRLQEVWLDLDFGQAVSGVPMCHITNVVY